MITEGTGKPRNVNWLLRNRAKMFLQVPSQSRHSPPLERSQEQPCSGQKVRSHARECVCDGRQEGCYSLRPEACGVALTRLLARWPPGLLGWGCKIVEGLHIPGMQLEKEFRARKHKLITSSVALSDYSTFICNLFYTCFNTCTAINYILARNS